jgi:hypothetical protein
LALNLRTLGVSEMSNLIRLHVHGEGEKYYESSALRLCGGGPSQERVFEAHELERVELVELKDVSGAVPATFVAPGAKAPTAAEAAQTERDREGPAADEVERDSEVSMPDVKPEVKRG